MPWKLYGMNYEKFFTSVFKDVNIIKSSFYSKVNKNIDHKVVDVDTMTDEQKIEALPPLIE